MNAPAIKLRINLTPDKEHITVVKSAKRQFEAVDSDSETDSEIEFMPRKAAPIKKRKMAPAIPPVEIFEDNDGDDEGEALADEPCKGRPEVAAVGGKTLMAPTMSRKERLVSASADAALIATAIKASDDIYLSDVENPEPIAGTTKPHLFKNVVWGPEATDINYAGSVFPQNPEFRQFVPGRWERQPDGTLLDQKSKLLIKFTDKNGQKRIFTNPPPKDWSCQEAISALNKRCVQQIRRNTAVRFRQVVKAYIPEERQWILDNLKNGKPQNGWKAFVKDFNTQFSGRTIPGHDEPRPERSHSSLTKEVERFGPEFYSKGLIPPGSKTSSKPTTKVSDTASTKTSCKTSDNAPTKTSDKTNTKASTETSSKTSGKTNKKASTKTSDKVTGKTTGKTITKPTGRKSRSK
ncbi:hypothetical protein DM02DRAFT_693839 [Periconia macrospinosa]|uniref:Uncharacterized protein n=1 Tax=Periconia macrospinosa TaxID=97972 RepID=A0A2V1E0N6_9PLEO|nr:hypothetical protein DM02DRAFT_693839 [Periconia macrospinosa]